MRVKINNFKEKGVEGTVWVTKCKQVACGEYRADFSPDPENAYEFDEDDYSLKLFVGWFGKENVELCG